MKRPWLKRFVPRAWTGEEALCATQLLRQAIDAIWAVHGDDMAAQIGEWPQERWCELMNCEEPDDDDIPF